MRFIVSWALFVCLVLFFLPVIVAVQSVINLDNFAGNAVVDWLVNAPVLGGALLLHALPSAFAFCIVTSVRTPVVHAQHHDRALCVQRLCRA